MSVKSECDFYGYLFLESLESLTISGSICVN